MKNYGKQFEKKFKQDFLATVPNASVDRLYDVTTGYKSIKQVCDFICYSYPNIFYTECKSCLGNTFPFSNLSQYDKLKKKVGIKGVRVGVVIWFRDHGKVFYVPIKTITQMMKDGKKSVNVNKSIEEGYRIINVPSTPKQVFVDSDYSCLLELNEGD